MNIPDFSVRRPVTIIMFFLGILFLGAISWTKLPQELFPPITFPQISVVTYYGNAAPEEIETLITRPIEESIGSVSGLKHIYSRSREGLSIVTIAFDWDVKIDFAALAVREKIDLIKERLPVESDDPVVIKFNPLERPIVILSVTGGESLVDLRNISRKSIKDNLEKVEGVASANVSGGLEREIIVEVDQAKLTSSGASLINVVDAISKTNVNYPAGTIKKGLYEYLIRTEGEFTKISDIDYVIVSVDDVSKVQALDKRRQYVEQTYQGPRETTDTSRAKESVERVEKRLIMLRDLAEVKDGIKEQTSISRYNNQENISISIQKQAGYNTIRVVERVLEKLEEIKSKEIPDNVQVEVIYDHSTFIKNAIIGVRDNAIQGGILAFFVLFYFLRNFRTSLIVSFCIPIAIMGTFFLMFSLGLTINMMTLGGLALGVGMMVDNAIVVIENIFRYRQLGIGPKAAAIVGTNEVVSAIFSSTLTSIAVFVPLILFIPGLSGQLFRELSWTVIFSLIMSFVVAISLIPLMAVGIKTKKQSLGTIEEQVNRPLWFSRLDPKKQNKVIYAVLGGLAAIFVGSLLLVKTMELELLPKIDQGQFIIRVEYPTGTVLDATNETINQIEKVVLKNEVVESTAVSIGVAKGAGASGSLVGSHQGQILVTLKEDRKLSSQEIVDQVKSELEKYQFDKARISFILQESEFQFLATGGAPVVVQVRGYEPILMDRIVDEVKLALSSIEGVTDIRDDRSEPYPETKVLINKEKAALNAISVNDISLTAKIALNGAVASAFKEAGQETPIRVKLREDDRSSFLNLGNLMIRSPALQTTLPLRELSKIETGLGPSEIKRVDQERTTLVLANIQTGYSPKKILEEVETQTNRIDRYYDSFMVGMAGESEEVKDTNQKFIFALLLSIILIYMIMASQFESLFQPFVVMFTVPLSLIGVILALFITNTSISAIVMLGVIMLGGIVVNNGIVLIEYINMLLQEGENLVEACEKAAIIRTRPILMSALTSIFGLIPLALGIGEGAELRAPMAIAVMGGLITSTGLTLFVIPMVFYVLKRGLDFIQFKTGQADLSTTPDKTDN